MSRALDYEIRTTRHGVSANHLLNFSLPEREKNVYVKKKKSGPTRTQSEFLHANFRFVVAPRDDDENTPFWDMEALTEWTSVEQVLLWHDDASPMSCPICLDDFRAPKITNWSCILRYLSLSDKYWRRCPMCFDSVQKGQLRSVRIETVDLPPRVDADATFQFLQRDKSSFFPHLPTTGSRTSTVARRTRKLPSVYDPAAMYARILEADEEYVTQLLLSELRDLQALDAEYRSSGDIDSLPFVEEAMRATSGRLAQHDDRDEVYSFYQLSNGIYVVLHPLNMKCLLKEFAEPKPKDAPATEDGEQARGDADVSVLWAEASSLSSASSASEVPSAVRYDLLPERVRGRILEVEHVVMDDDVRKRYRFLSHLPKFCDFYLCELDLSELLSPATLGAFRGEIKKRERQRKQKQKSKRQSATSPVFKNGARAGFSIEQAGIAWPAPSESSLSEALEESLRLNHDGLGGEDESGDGESPSHLHHSEASSSSPPSPAFPGYVDEGSFATITRQSGYYPPLGSSGSASNGFTDSARSPSTTAWGVSAAGGSGAPPLFDLDLDALPRSGGKGKRGAAKKGVALFSTSQHRSYR
ncbi:hypothetical protein PybrP1_009688 [[Pythium] brassicae (nom. inval.)]|nr:hypothetical protein PybrP1_009688 [[Pythium] brassicae (nom. inval.)]